MDSSSVYENSTPKGGTYSLNISKPNFKKLKPKFLDYVYRSKPKAKIKSAPFGIESITNHKRILSFIEWKYNVS